jgi:hypothetical protein
MTSFVFPKVEFSYSPLFMASPNSKNLAIEIGRNQSPLGMNQGVIFGFSFIP